jgi:hypothetical protein
MKRGSRPNEAWPGRPAGQGSAKRNLQQPRALCVPCPLSSVLWAGGETVSPDPGSRSPAPYVCRTPQRYWLSGP